MEKKLTTWFGGDTKPDRIGVCERKSLYGICCYSKWNGSAWMAYKPSIDLADGVKSTSQHQNWPWRGLTSDPKSSKP